jgi:hypothetical protein
MVVFSMLIHKQVVLLPTIIFNWGGSWNVDREYELTFYFLCWCLNFAWGKRYLDEK